MQGLLMLLLLLCDTMIPIALAVTARCLLLCRFSCLTWAFCDLDEGLQGKLSDKSERDLPASGFMHARMREPDPPPYQPTIHLSSSSVE